VPIVGGDLGGNAAGDLGFIEVSSGNVEQSDNAPEQVEGMGPGKNVEEAAGGIGGEINALRLQLTPDHQLSGKKHHSQNRRKAPISFEFLQILDGELLARQFYGAAAGEKNEGIEP
jgi:hypothetical protein